MNQWQFPGSRWWKFDFHTHTPASEDFLKGCDQQEKDKVTPEFWLRKFMEKEIDCVAVTDHNSGEWIDELKAKLKELEQEKPAWRHPLHLFPGVEISAAGGVHILAIFDPEKGGSDIDRLLGAVGYPATSKGGSYKETKKSVAEVIDVIAERGGIAIPAHADKDKGLFESSSLRQALENKNIYAVELCDENYEKPQQYTDRKMQWTEVRGSDTHNFWSKNFGEFTWIKMDNPSIEGLKLALIDGALSVKRRIMDISPNRHAEYLIEEITVKDAKHMGLEGDGELKCQFNPFLNVIIGGRGSGKSTLLEFMRLALQREKEVLDFPKSDILKSESKKYFTVGADGLLLETSHLSLVYRKGETRYRLSWSAPPAPPSLEVEEETGWEAMDGDIRSLFPARIYSQKQIFALAQEPDALLDVIDEHSSVKYAESKRDYIDRKNGYKRLGQTGKELKAKIAEEAKYSGLLKDVSRQIDEIGKSGHKTVLQNYRQRHRQQSIMDDLETQWKRMTARLSEAREEIGPSPLEEQPFSQHGDMLQAIVATNKEWEEIDRQLGALIEKSQNIVSNWRSTKDNAEWMKALQDDIATYAQLHAQLQQQGVDPEKHPQLLQQQTEYEKKLEQIDKHAESLEKVEQDKKQTLMAIKQGRDQLTEKRRSFLTSILKGNSSVAIKLKHLGQGWEGIEASIRKILHCEDRFDRDFEELKGAYENQDKNIAIQSLKERLLNIHDGADGHVRDQRFANHIKQLTQDSISELMCWFPQDALEIYAIAAKDEKQNIQQGSPGQKTAALLAFILSYGEEPLLLDQPEDDLDNELIYGLIVEHLRKNKNKRQIIVVTHNANIVVNGDAEMVLPLTVKSGQSFISAPAGIQNRNTREKICDILEGGKQAFEQRYKRIHLEN